MHPMSPVAKARSVLMITLTCWLAPASLAAQIIEFDPTIRGTAFTTAADKPGPSFLNAVGVEAMTTAMQASTQLARVDIGVRPISFPLFFLVGAAGSAWGADGPEAAIANILNPLSGNFNVRIADGKRVTPSSWTETVVEVTYDLGGKQFSATDAAGAGVQIFVGSAQAGLRLETKAVLNKIDAGIAYLQVTAGGHETGGGGSLQRLFGPGTRNRFASLAVDAGIQIKNILMAKFSFYQAMHPGTNAVLEKAIFKGGFEYHPE